jgi:RecA-family ATPase
MANADGSRFKLYEPAELDTLPKPSWLIEGILPANALGVLYGAPSVGKTFVALSIALSIAAGHQWCGKHTKSGSVLYVAAEGVSGMRLRIRAYQERHGITAERIRFLGEGFDLRRAADIQKLTSTLEDANFRPDLIVLDTLARLIPGADENHSKDMGEAIRAIEDLRREFEATVLLIHHTGKNGDLERGSGALRGAADVMIKCGTRGDRKLVSIECNKMKEAEQFKPATIKLERLIISSTDSSLAVTNWRDQPETQDQSDTKALHEDELLEVLETQFPHGATNTELERAFSWHAKMPAYCNG